MFINSMQNFHGVNGFQFIDYIETELIKKCNDLIKWKNKNNNICIDIRDEISTLNYIHCFLTETLHGKFNILLYDNVNVNGEIYNNDCLKWFDFIVLCNDGDIYKYEYMHFSKCNIVNCETGENENLINKHEK